MKISTLFPRVWCWLLVLLAGLSAAHAQQVAAPTLGAAASYGLLSGSNLVAANSSSPATPLPVRVRGKAGAADKIGAGVQASAGVYDYGGGTVLNALTDVQKARTYCTSLGGTALSGPLGGQTLAGGAYQVTGNATLGAGATLTLTGDTATVLVLNVTGSLALAGQARVVLNGVLPQHVFWNVGTSLSVASGTVFPGVALAGGSIALSGLHFGQCALLSQGGITLTDLSATAGSNLFYAAARPSSYCDPGSTSPACTGFARPGSELLDDGSFEVARCVPAGYEGLSFSPSSACFWQSATVGTSDYFLAGAGPDVSVPYNGPGLQYPRSPQPPQPVQQAVRAMGQNSPTQAGKAYAGFFAYDTLSPSYFEYIIQRNANRSLRAGHHYYVEMAVRLAPGSGYAVPALHLAVQPANWELPSNYLGQITLPPSQRTLTVGGEPPLGTLSGPDQKWRRGGAVYTPTTDMPGFTVLIGNMAAHQTLLDGLSEPQPAEQFSNSAYYYVDNVTMSQITEAGDPVTLGSPCQGGASSTTLGTLPMPTMTGATYAWRIGSLNNPTVSYTIANPTVTPTQTTTYWLTVTIPGQTQTYSSSVTVTVVNAGASAAFTWTQTDCRSITATPAVTVAGATYTWTWGDNEPNTTQDSSPAPHLYPGTDLSYSVTLQVQVPGCALVTSTQIITLAPPPATPNFTIQVDCSGLATTTLTGAVVAGTTYVWKWGDNNGMLTGPGPYTHQYTANGTYPVTITATNSVNCSTTATQQVAVNVASAAFTWTPTGCRSITATPAVTVAGATYTWTWGDSPNTTQSSPPPHTYSGTDLSYQVTLQVQVPGCALVTSTQTITLPTPPPVPTFTVQADCRGLTTNTLNGPEVAGTTYVWNWSDGNVTLTGPGPYDHQYTMSGTYTVTITATNGAGCSTTATQQVSVTLGNACCPGGAALLTLLGQAGQTTTLTGGATYSGLYWVRGDLLLTDGTYTLTPGTVFYVDGEATRQPTAGPVDEREVRGATITLGNGAWLEVDGATLTAAGSTPTCPMWRGIVVEGNLPPNSPPQVVIGNGSVISHAYCALTVTRRSYPALGGVAYSLTNSSFLHNLTHVLDMGMRKGGMGPAIIENCTFDSESSEMRYPYNATSVGDQYVTYQALQLLPDNDGNFNADAVQVTNNTIRRAIYGIVNNVPGPGLYHDVLIQGNRLSEIYQTGIWAVDNRALPQGGLAAGTVSDNEVELSDWGGQVTEQLAATNLRIGLSNESSQMGLYRSTFRNNTVVGQVGVSRPQIGLNLYYRVEARGNTLRDLTEGLRTTALDEGRVFDNHTTDCESGVTVLPSDPYVYQARIGCNTFERAQSAAPVLYGINVVDQADVNDQGEQFTPAGNAFLFARQDEKVFNEGANPNFTYWGTRSPQEDVRTIGGRTRGVAYPSLISYDFYCNNQDALNGVNRGTPPSPGYIAALADTVRRQLVPRAQRRAYLNAVLHYYLQAGRAASLEAWWATLLPGNAEDYRTAGLRLLSAYDQPPATAADAQRVLAGLQPQALLDANLAAELALRQVERHLPATAPLLARADSTQLTTLAWSGTAAAGRAGRWLRYFHPRVPLPAATPDPLRPAARPAPAPAPTARPLAAAQLGEAYPNPARTEVSIACQLPAEAGGGTLCLSDLLTGRPVLEIPVPGGAQPAPLRVALAGLAAGPYAYRLLVEGRPVSGARKLVVLP